MLRKFSADYVFPVSSPPIKNGVVTTDEKGVIISVSAPSKEKETEYYSGIIIPGIINAHCHLELSHLKGSIPEHRGLDEFIMHIEAIRKGGDEEMSAAINSADEEMFREGIVAVGDISNKRDSFSAKAKSKILYHTFLEVFGFHPSRADEVFSRGLSLKKELEQSSSKFKVQSSVTPHAPYSATAELLNKICEHAEENNSVLTIHNQETEDENNLFLNKTGKILKRLEKLGIDTSLFKPTGKKSLASVLPHLPKKNKIQFVHNTFTTSEEIDEAFLYNPNLFWCFCPNANLYIENRLPDIKMFYNKKLKCTIGTDSLASNHQLSMLEEMKTIQNNFPEIPLEEIIRWATLNGAELLGFNNSLGTIEKNKTPGLVHISNVDLKTMRLTKESKATRLI
ncbi:MAG TPA: amidohydrolase family protein [Bacteroidia bacterium]|nr:amidohydrolase family protein [Bacteroidia bacterium]